MRKLFFPRTARTSKLRRPEAFVRLELLEDRAVPALFTSLTPQTPGGLSNTGCVATGDFNGDGKLDLVTTNVSNGRVNVLLGDGTGNFTNQNNYTPDASNTSVNFVAVGDLNGDGNLDFITVQSANTSTEEGGTYTVFLGDGKGNFTQEQPVATGGDYATWVGIGDFNGDGIPDIAITNAGYGNSDAGTVTGQGMIVLAGTNGGNGKGTGDFSTPLFQTDSSDLGFIPNAATIGDFNGDGALDIAAVYPGVPADSGDPQPDGSVDIYLNSNDGTGGMTLYTTFDSGGSLPVSIVSGDMNGDGKTDLVIANAGDPYNNEAGTDIAVISGDGTGNFPSSKILTTDLTSNASAFAVAISDLNEDGYPDIAAVNAGTIGGATGSFIDYLNNGSGSFTAESKYTDSSSGPNQPQYLAVGNFNNSGGPDVVTVGINPHIRTYINDGLASTTTIAPSSPSITSGNSETFTATVSGTGAAPTGSVIFYDGTTKLGSGTISTVGSAQEATYTTSTLAIGTHNVTAHYTGETTPAYYFVSTSSATIVTVTSGTNQPPTIGSIANQTINAGSTDGPINFTIGDESPSTVTLSATSTNTALIPVSAITFGGSGTARTVSIATITGSSGSATITVIAMDNGGLTATSQFTVTVNGPPTIGSIANQTIALSSSTGPIAFTVGDESPSTLSLSATSTNTAVIPVSAITFGGSGTARTVNVASNTTTGSSTITVTVTDNGSLTAQTTFTVTVNGTNQPPTISTVSNQTVNAGTSTGPLAITIGDESPATVSLSAASTNTALIPVSAITFGGSGTARTVNVATITGSSGSATITITAMDNGGLTATSQFIVTVNGPPSVGTIANQTVNAGNTAGPVSFTIGDETPASVTLSAASSNPALIPVSAVAFGGSGTARTVFVATTADTSGTATITITAMDSGGLTAARTFTVTVNGPPSIGTIANQTVTAGSSTGAVAFTIGDESPASVTLSAASTNAALIPVSAISFGGSGTSRTVSVASIAGTTGSSTITVTATDTGGLTTSTTFTVTVNAPVNTPPSITAIANQSVLAGSAVGPVNFLIGDNQDAPTALTLSVATSDPALIPTSAVTFGGSGGSRTISVSTVAGFAGVTTLTVTVMDSGGLTASTSFTVTQSLTPPNTAPTITGLGNQSTTEGLATGAISFTIGDAETAAASLTLSATSSNAALVPVSGIIFGGSGASRTVTITPTPAKLGTSTITITVTDGGGLTASESFVLTVSPVPAGRTLQFSISSDAGQVATVKFFNPDGTERFSLTPFGTSFTGGIRTATADFNGDGVGDLVVASGPGITGEVMIFDGVTGKQIFDIKPFETFSNGINVAVGDMNGDGLAELSITADHGGGARDRIFSPNGSGGFTQLADFIGITTAGGGADLSFRGGGRSAIGDINGDGYGDLVFAAGEGGGPRIAIFDGKNLKSDGSGPKLTGDFFAFESTLRNGTYVSVGDVDGDGYADLVVGAGPGGGPRVTVFSGKDLMDGIQTREKDFFAGDINNRGGVRVTVKNLDGDADSDIIVGSGTGAGSEATAYLGKDLMATTDLPPAPYFDFDAFPGFTGGIFVG